MSTGTNDASTRPYPLVGLKEAAAILGVSKQRADQLRKAGRLPAPVAVLAATTVWSRADIEAFAKKPRPSGRPLEQPASNDPEQAR